METGQVYTHQFQFSQQQVDAFAALSGDTNPIHTDAAYAATTIFRKPIIHGFLSGSVFSKVLGTQFPGEGTIYLKQTMEFKAPLFVDISYEAVFTVKEILPGSVALISTQIKDTPNGNILVDGEASVKNRQKIKKI
ncbi:MaoC family dehydratase [Rhodocytophaga rosea]|uniref:MaoC family dehydratase n=1 Tax=Rhodocytophaga rosea TaxID=2704465 RepID=A0A6C0GV77_9BACT|nr:MaoC family dehydratase [Rhodocytophaga rosea]QHT71242.1 MaoC family dehydratase [Rhodocytophaga rosea]